MRRASREDIISTNIRAVFANVEVDDLDQTIPLYRSLARGRGHAVMLTLLSDQLGFMLGFTAKPDALDEPTEVAAGDWTLVVDQGPRLVPAGTHPSAPFTGTTELFDRLLGGRLTERHTPVGTEVTGSVTLDELRRVFSGF